MARWCGYLLGAFILTTIQIQTMKANKKEIHQMSLEDNPEMGVWEQNEFIQDINRTAKMLNKTNCWICMHVPPRAAAGLLMTAIPLSTAEIAYENPEFEGGTFSDILEKYTGNETIWALGHAMQLTADICFEVFNKTNGIYLGRYEHCTRTIAIDAEQLTCTNETCLNKFRNGTWLYGDKNNPNKEFGWTNMGGDNHCRFEIFGCSIKEPCLKHNEGNYYTCKPQSGTPLSCRTSDNDHQAWMCSLISFAIQQVNGTAIENKTLPLFKGGVWWLCGRKAYASVPPNWTGKCTIGWVVPSIYINQTLPQGRLRNRRGVEGEESGLTLGGRLTTQIARGIIPALGVAVNYRDIHILNNWTTVMFNQTIKALKRINQEIREIRTVVLQNRYALDFMLAAKGGTCALIGDHCCTFIHDYTPNISKTVQHMEDMVRNNPLAEPDGTGTVDIWGALWSWLPSGWLSGLIRVLVLVAGALIGVCCCVQCLPNLIGMAAQCCARLTRTQGYENTREKVSRRTEDYQEINLTEDPYVEPRKALPFPEIYNKQSHRVKHC